MSDCSGCNTFGLVVGIAGLLSFGGWTVFPSHPIFGMSTPEPLIQLQPQTGTPPQANFIRPVEPPPAMVSPAPAAPPAPAITTDACAYRSDTVWTLETNAELGNVISRCAGDRYFAFQCTHGSVSLVTIKDNLLRHTRFFQHRRYLEGYDIVLSPFKSGSYNFYNLIDERGVPQFYVFRNATLASLEAMDGEVTLDLTGLHSLARRNFSAACVGADPI